MKEKGILGEVERKLGRLLSKAIEMRVKPFYRDDQYSRLMPGAKDYKSVVEEGKRTRKQKRLILMNLNELYQNYKAIHPFDKIGLSKFAALRPSECTTHQNVKLMVHTPSARRQQSHLQGSNTKACSTDDEHVLTVPDQMHCWSTWKTSLRPTKCL